MLLKSFAMRPLQSHSFMVAKINTIQPEFENNVRNASYHRRLT